jgi:hypothetical protein
LHAVFTFADIACTFGAGITCLSDGFICAFDIVDFTVAIVVFAVTLFGLGGQWFCTTFYTSAIGFTDIFACIFTFADTDSAWFIKIEKIFVDSAIAIVIKAIADLFFGQDFAHTSAPLASSTGLHSIFALPDISGVAMSAVTRLSQRFICAFDIVDLTVTIVVFSIASLFPYDALYTTAVFFADIYARCNTIPNFDCTSFAQVGPIFID